MKKVISIIISFCLCALFIGGPARAMDPINPIDSCMVCDRVLDYWAEVTFDGNGKPVLSLAYSYSTTGETVNYYCEAINCQSSMLHWGYPFYYRDNDPHYFYGWTEMNYSCGPSDCQPGTISFSAYKDDYLPPGDYAVHFDAGLHCDSGSECSSLCEWIVWVTVPDCSPDTDADGYNVCIDCDETNPDIHPGAPELCNDIDDNCDGQVDEDSDGDGYSPCEGDCDDGDPTIFPGAPELCDRKDNDCDGVTPEDEIDDDGDTFTECEGDCDDTNVAVNPEAPEICDGLDNDCDGFLSAEEYDDDIDGYDECTEPVDCNDSNSSIYPGAVEICNLMDDDCDGAVDEDCYPDPGPPPSCMISVGAPVNVASGNMYLHPKTDLHIKGVVFDIDFSRVYNSQSDYDGPLGYGWTYSYNLRLENDNPGEIIIHDQYDSRNIYILSDDGKYYSITGDSDYVESDGDNFILVKGDRYYEFASGRLSAIETWSGHTMEFVYSNDLLTSISEIPRGISFALREVILEYDGNGRLWKIYPSAASPAVVEYRYDADGNLQDALYADGSALHYDYNDLYDSHNLTRITDSSGRILEAHDYDDQDRAVTSYSEGNLEFVGLTYDEENKTTVASTSSGQKTITYDFVNGVAVGDTITGGACNCSNEEDWDSDTVRLNRAVDGRGYDTVYSDFDSLGNPQTVTRAAGTAEEQTFQYTYHSTFNKISSETDPLGTRTAYTYDSLGNLKYVYVVVDGTYVTLEEYDYEYEWSAEGTPYFQRMTFENGYTITYYDYVEGDPDSGMISSKRGSVSWNTAHYSDYGDYDVFGNPGWVQGPDGILFTMTYDGLGRLATKTNTATGGVTEYFYDPLGYLDYVVEAGARTTDYQYDVQGNLLSMTDPLGNRIVYDYDSAGNRTSEERFDSSGTRTYCRHFDYDADDRLWKIHYADGTWEENEYDANGNLVRHWDGGRTLTEYAYDSLNRLETITRAGVIITSYGYDTLGRITSVTDGNGNTTSYTYDGYGFLTSVDSPDTGLTQYTEYYKGQIEHGLVKTRIDNSGTTFTYTYRNYDRQALPLKVEARDNNTVYRYGYWYRTDNPPYGKISYVGNETYSPNDAKLFYYDEAARPYWKRFVVDEQVYETYFTYNIYDELETITYPSGRVVTFERDGAGNISRVSGLMYDQTTIYAENVTYYPFGGIKSFTRGNGLTETITLDQDYRIASIDSGGSILYRDYSYYADQNIAGISNNIYPNESQSFTYDSQGRLAGASGYFGSRAWAYDNAGNRLTEDGNGSVTVYNYESGTNRLTSLSGVRESSFTYDSDGNMTADGQINYRYDNFGRLMSSYEGSYYYLTYQYLPTGERISKEDTRSEGSARHYHYDLEDRLIGESLEDGTWIVDYIWLRDHLLARVQNGLVTDRQEGYTLSKRNDFLTEDRSYTTADYMYVKVWTTEEDYSSLDGEPKATLVSAANSKVKKNITLTNRYDGAYEGIFVLSDLSLRRGGNVWHFSAEINDASGNPYTPSDTIYVYETTAGLPDLKPGLAWGPGTVERHFAMDGGFFEVFRKEGSDLSGHAQLACLEPLSLPLFISARPARGPKVTSCTPGRGPIEGGTYVEIAGRDFQGGADVFFGDYEASGVIVYSKFLLSCYTPAHDAGAVDVTVVNSDGGSGVLEGGFTFEGPPEPPSDPFDMVYWYHLDHLGTPQVLTDSSGQVAWEGLYEPFGGVTVIDEDGNMILEALERVRFPGQYFDEGTGLHYNWWRYYNPELGRYLEADPVGIQNGRNHLYFYALDPSSQIDFFGLWGSDIHSGIGNYMNGTYTWAMDAGFSSEDAATIALANNATDEFANFAAIVGVPGRHFDTALGFKDSRTLFADASLSLAVSLYKNCMIKEALRALGKGLHSVQDTYAHANAPFYKVHPKWYDDPLINYEALLNTRVATADYFQRFLLQVNYRVQ